MATEDDSELSNMERYFETRANTALEAYNKGDYETCDAIASQLLLKPELPILWRAQCNLLMATVDDHTAIEYAKGAIKWYKRALENSPSDEYLAEMLKESEDALKKAEEDDVQRKQRKEQQQEVKVPAEDESVRSVEHGMDQGGKKGLEKEGDDLGKEDEEVTDTEC